MEITRKPSFFSRAKNFIKEFVASDEEISDESFNASEFKGEDEKTLKMLQEQSSKIDEKAKTMFEDKAEKRKGLKKSINAEVQKVDVKAKKPTSKQKEAEIEREIED